MVNERISMGDSEEWGILLKTSLRRLKYEHIHCSLHKFKNCCNVRHWNLVQQIIPTLPTFSGH